MRASFQSSGLNSGTERLIFGFQDGVISILVYRRRILRKEIPSDRCRACPSVLAGLKVLHLLELRVSDSSLYYTLDAWHSSPGLREINYICDQMLGFGRLQHHS